MGRAHGRLSAIAPPFVLAPDAGARFAAIEWTAGRRRPRRRHRPAARQTRHRPLRRVPPRAHPARHGHAARRACVVPSEAQQLPGHRPSWHLELPLNQIDGNRNRPRAAPPIARTIRAFAAAREPAEPRARFSPKRPVRTLTAANSCKPVLLLAMVTTDQAWGTGSTRKLGVALVAALCLCLLIASAASAATKAPSGLAFYNPPARLVAGKPGTVIWSRAVRTPSALPAAGRTTLVLYRSVLPNGRSTAVSGLIFTPRGKAPKGGLEAHQLGPRHHRHRRHLRSLARRFEPLRGVYVPRLQPVAEATATWSPRPTTRVSGRPARIST